MAPKTKISAKGKRTATSKKKTKKVTSWTAVKHLATKAMKGVNFVKGIVNAEKKYNDVTQTGAVDYNGSVVALSAVSQGDTSSTRNGNSILAKGLQVRYQVFPDMTAANQTRLRMLIFQDTMSLGTIPSPGDVLENVGASTAPQSPYKYINATQYRFKILYDKTHNISNVSNGHTVDEKFIVNDHIKFTGTTGTDEGRNMLYSLVISDRVTTLTPYLNMTTRLSFYDN